MESDEEPYFPENVKFRGMPIALALLPVAIQVSGIAAFLYVTRQEIAFTFAAIFLSLIWLKVSEENWVQDIGEKRASRHLFGQIGKWLDQEDAEKIFDDAQSKYLMIDGSIESDDNKAVVTAAGIANSLRGAASVLVRVYLLYVVITSVFQL